MTKITYWSAPYPQSQEHAEAIRRALRGETATINTMAGTFANWSAKPVTLDDVKAAMAELDKYPAPLWWPRLDIPFRRITHADVESKEKR